MTPSRLPLPCLLYLSFALFLAALLWTNSDLLPASGLGFLIFLTITALGWRFYCNQAAKGDSSR